MSLRRLACAAAAAAMVVVVGTASAQSVKFKSFHATGMGMSLTPEVDGIAKIKFNSGQNESRISVQMQDLAPQAVYSVAVMSDANSTSPDFVFPDALTTNDLGTGNFEGVAQAFDFGSAPCIYIFVWDGDVEHLVDDVAPSEARAYGTAGE